MKDLPPELRNISPATLTAIWAAVAHQPDATVRELARRAQVSHGTAGRALRALIAWGKVTEERQRAYGQGWSYKRQVAPPETLVAVPLRPRLARDQLLELETLRAQIRRERADYAALAAAAERLVAATIDRRASIAELLDAADAVRRVWR